VTSRDEPPSVALGPGEEFDVVRDLIARWGARAQGIGDDAALLALPRGDRLVASVDTAIERRHFRDEWLTAGEIGYRSVTAALSDLAAMGATPLGVLVALALPSRWRERVGELADGIAEAVDAAGTRIVGGNTSGADDLSITTTVLGTAYSVLRRAGLHPGEALYLTGTLGAPGAALAAWRRGDDPAPAHRSRFARPAARLREARWLGVRGASAAIDISDGLAGDLQHLAAASGVDIEVDLSLVPRADGVRAIDAAESGEEYELVVGTAGTFDTEAFEHTFGIPLTLIGHVPRAGNAVMLHIDGKRVANPPGYDHLSR